MRYLFPILILGASYIFLCCTPKDNKPTPNSNEKEAIIASANTEKAEEKNTIQEDIMIPEPALADHQSKTDISDKITSKEALKTTTLTTKVKEEKKTVVPKAKEIEIKEQAKPIEVPKENKSIKTVRHDQWNSLLQKYVSSTGVVDYTGLKSKKSEVKKYLDYLSSNAPQSSWSKNETMAYWINAYNAYTIYLVLDNWPTKSIMDISGGKVWTTKKLMIGGNSYTLDHIEKKLLIKAFNEPRIHFAVNCAAASCPPLYNKAWTASNVQAQLDARARIFINDSKYNRLGSSKVSISKIFEWYSSDFGGKEKLVSYIKKYSNTSIKSDAQVSFLEYNWSINGR